MAWKIDTVNMTATDVTKKGHISLRIDASMLVNAMDQLKTEVPKMANDSMYGAVRKLRSHLVEVMDKGGGIYGVPKFKEYDPFTKSVRAIRGYTGKMGGVLAEDYAIVAYKQGKKQIIGYPDGATRTSEKSTAKLIEQAGGSNRVNSLADFAVKFQTGEGKTPDEFADPESRAKWGKIPGGVPTAYAHNPRPFIDHFAAHVGERLNEMADEIFIQKIAAKIKKALKNAKRKAA